MKKTIENAELYTLGIEKVPGLFNERGYLKDWVLDYLQHYTNTNITANELTCINHLLTYHNTHDAFVVEDDLWYYTTPAYINSVKKNSQYAIYDYKQFLLER